MLGVINIGDTVLMGFLNNRKYGEMFVISIDSLENKRNASFVLSVIDLLGVMIFLYVTSKRQG